MNILAFETSCDETAVAVVRDGREILASEVLSQTDLHALYGGVVPEIASRSHLEALAPLTAKALSGMEGGVDAVAATAAPGLIGALLVGLNFAKGYAMALGLPLIPVHHIRGHIAAAYLAEPELEPPFFAAVVSGGNTLLIEVLGYTEYRVAGGTRDDAAGEAFDKAARLLGLGYPGGAALSRLAETGDDTKYAFPRAAIQDAPFDMSFSGVKTALRNLVHNAKQLYGDGWTDALDLPSVAASYQKAVVDVLVSRIVAAADALAYHTVVLAGGVAANRKLCAELRVRLGSRIHIPPVYLCGDNAAMIGSQAYYEALAGVRAPLSQNAYATYGVEKALCQIQAKTIPPLSPFRGCG
ncbi:MAG: tRNA (adenosine(37)-N6)-threonylcarbamoyltransferase complex transferase subunit TsaD [Oscillospiraceae bacterium]|jgi:N6-L-threonylcarbamoyladenine synthase|nr:tRNA (adenosine(37)-N6)-threonylcarbamoyltransferase complex transferase subunit TsaD [Oscillospiraceae bacterium]